MGHLIDVADRGQLLLRPPGGPPRMLSPDSGRWRESAAGGLFHDDPDLRLALMPRSSGDFRLILALEEADEVVYAERRLTVAQAFSLLPEPGRRWAERKVREAAIALSDQALGTPHSGRGAERAWADALRLCRAAGILVDLAAVLDPEERARRSGV